MQTTSAWVIPTPASKYNVPTNQPATSVDSPLSTAAGPALIDAAPPWHVDNPLFWFGAIAAATFGLLAVSTSVRVGPARVSAALGDT
jgi:hypothetical protein